MPVARKNGIKSNRIMSRFNNSFQNSSLEKKKGGDKIVYDTFLRLFCFNKYVLIHSIIVIYVDR